MNRRFVIDRLLHHSNNFTSCLTPNALFYLLLSDENNPTEVIQLLQARGFTDTTVVLSRNARPFVFLFFFLSRNPLQQLTRAKFRR